MPSHKKQLKFEEVEPLALEVKDWLQKHEVKKVMICGSLRRRCPNVGDIDVVVSEPLNKTVAALKALPGRAVLLLSNEKNIKKAADFLIDAVQVNVFATADENFGAMVMYLTGSKGFNIVIRGRAKKLGMKLNQYGLFLNGEVMAGRTEEQIFMALGLEYLEPEKRQYALPGEEYRVLLKEKVVG